MAERILLAILLGGIAVGCVFVILPFFSAILWAGILVFTTWPVYSWLRDRLKSGGTVPALAMITLTALLVVLPLAIAAPGGAGDADRLRHIVEDSLRAGLPSAPSWLAGIPLVGTGLAEVWNRSIVDLSWIGDMLRPYAGNVAESGFNLLLGIAGGIASFILALFVAFFFYLHGDAISARMSALLRRVAGERADRLIEVTGLTVRGTVYGILGTAIVQGFLTAFGLYISGVPRPVLLGVVAGFVAVFPVGAPLVWIPAALWLLSDGHIGWGIFLGLYGVIVVSGADSIIRPWFIARGASLPFVLTVLGVLGGAIAFGLIGVFLGPVLLGVGFTLANEWVSDGEAQSPEFWE